MLPFLIVGCLENFRLQGRSCQEPMLPAKAEGIFTAFAGNIGSWHELCLATRQVSKTISKINYAIQT